MGQYAFFFDQGRCYSCHACAVACKDWNGLEPGPEKWMSVYEWETGKFPNIKLHSLAFPCAHCDEPSCLKACPTGAIFKEDEYGAVLVDQEKCVGCRSCYEACPYGSPAFADDEGSRMSKCTMCIDKLAVGEIPVCVATCPLRAFDFGPVEEMREKYGDDVQLQGMPAPATKPNFIVKPSANHRDVVPYDAAKALELMKERDGLDDLFDEVSDITEISMECLESSELRMKEGSSEGVMRVTRNYAG